MNLRDIPFETTDGAAVPSTERRGASGVAGWRTRQLGDLRVRVLKYSPGYRADRWCEKGHILFCVEGELHTESKDGRMAVLKPGMSYHVADGAEAHRSFTPSGATLFVVD